MLGGLATAGLTAIIMVIVAITGESGTGSALVLLVLGGVILLVVGLWLIAYAVLPDDDGYEPRGYETHAWDRLGMFSDAARPVRPTQASRYALEPEWSIPGWEPPEGMEVVQGTRPPRPGQISKYPEWSIPGWEPPEDMQEPTPPAPPRRRPEREVPRAQVSKFDT